MKSSFSLIFVSLFTFACGSDNGDKSSSLSSPTPQTVERTNEVRTGVTHIQDRVDFEENLKLANESGSCQFLIPKSVAAVSASNKFIGEGENWKTIPDYRENLGLNESSTFTYISESENLTKVLTLKIVDDSTAVLSGACFSK